MKYSYKFKLKAVKHYLEKGYYLKVNTECNKPTYKQQVRVWSAIYKIHGKDALKHSKHKHFSVEQKLKIVDKYKAGVPMRKLAVLLGIEKSVVTRWIRKYELYGIEGLKTKSGRPPKSCKIQSSFPKSPYNNFKSTIEKAVYINKEKEKTKKALKEYLNVYKFLVLPIFII